MSQHTLGPWTLYPAMYPGIDGPNGRSIIIYGEYDDGCGIRGGDTDEEVQANARLIAAAPEMHDALVDLVQKIQAKAEIFRLRDIDDIPLDKALAAIAKAKLP